MVIAGLHLLLTYQCTFECDHCFVFSCPTAKGVMKISDIRQILTEAKQTEEVKSICFEGGEPFLYFQTMLRGLKEARDFGFKRAIVTNAYWATSIEDAKEWLLPISRIGISDLSISDDAYHYDPTEENLAKYAYEAAKKLDLPVGKIAIEDPKIYMKETEWKRKQVIEGKTLLKGRAAEKLVEELPTKPWTQLDECQAENFTNQGRVHIDPFGYVHVCQGITIGNMKHTPLSDLLANYNPEMHPICGPILKGGPAELVKKYQVEHNDEYVDECHLCYSIRQKLRKRFTYILAPDQMYGM